MNLKGKSLKHKKKLIGDTPLIRRKKIEELMGLPEFLIKDESRNPFGTFKDRRNIMAIEDAEEEQIDKLILITSGNSGYSLARLVEGTGIKVVCIVDKIIDASIKDHLKKYAYNVIEVNLNQRIFYKEDIRKLATRESNHTLIRDVTNDCHRAFHSIIDEIENEDPDFLITPVGSGEAFVGLYQGLKRYRMKTKLIGVGVHKLQNKRLKLCRGPSIADKLYTPFTPYKGRIETILNEGHLYHYVSDENIKSTYQKIHHLIACEPSSASVYAAFSELDINKGSKIIVINSGKGIWGS